jgi:two-component system chemotaxis response regulator CheY
MRILIVEDDLVARQHLVRLLEDHGTCSVAVHGRQAVDAVRASLAKEEPYDLICLDINMPRLDGRACLDEIRGVEKAEGVAESRRAKIVMTTAVAPKDALVDLMIDGGCDGYICKPVREAVLIERLRKLGLIAAGLAPDSGGG